MIVLAIITGVDGDESLISSRHPENVDIWLQR